MNNSSAQELRKKILELETQQAEELRILKQQVSDTYESFRPANIIKNTLDHALSSPDIKDKIIDSAIGLGTGFITKKILLKNENSATGKLLGTVLQFVVAGLVSKKTDVIKNIGKDIIEFGLNIIERYKEKKITAEE